METDIKWKNFFLNQQKQSQKTGSVSSPVTEMGRSLQVGERFWCAEHWGKYWEVRANVKQSIFCQAGRDFPTGSLLPVLYTDWEKRVHVKPQPSEHNLYWDCSEHQHKAAPRCPRWRFSQTQHFYQSVRYYHTCQNWIMIILQMKYTGGPSSTINVFLTPGK